MDICSQQNPSYLNYQSRNTKENKTYQTKSLSKTYNKTCQIKPTKQNLVNQTNQTKPISQTKSKKSTKVFFKGKHEFKSTTSNLVK